MRTNWSLICTDERIKLHIGERSESVDNERLMWFIDAAKGKAIEAVNEHDNRANDHDEVGMSTIDKLREI
jgi:hypothetical protein